jgi:nitrogen fixation/metabolism regulation signal transduction histidine kinase
MNRYLAALKQLRSGLFPAVLLLVMTVGSLLLLSDSIQDSEHFTRLYSTLFAINVVILLLLLVLIGVNVQRVLRQYRRRVTGSRLTVRLVVIFVVLSLLPVSVVYYVAYRFINQGIDSWFDVRVEQALDASLELSRGALDVRARELTRQTEAFARDLADVADATLTLRLGDLRVASGATELTVFTPGGQVVASNSADPSRLLPNRPESAALMQARATQLYVGLEPGAGGATLQARVIVAVPGDNPVREERLLQALYPIPDRMNTLANAVQSAYTHYQELNFLRGPLKFSFTLTLSLVLLLGVLVAVWAAFISAQRLVEPIRVLTLGTRAVAEGNYDKRLTPQTHDELGVLVESFNEMTHKIALARDDAHRSQQEAEGERAYLKAVLGSLSSGVLTFDRHRLLRTSNVAADAVLAAEVGAFVGRDLEALRDSHAHLAEFAGVLQTRLAGSDDEWQEEIAIFGPAGRRMLLCRGRRLPGDQDGMGGYVVVFDDITALLQAERDAAWREVARRIAHEIRNPLTPIQLSAERLRHKYLATLDDASAEVLDRSTHTIIQQVESLKQMVSAFSEYARMPRMELAALNLNALVREVLDLYGAGGDTHFEMDLDPNLENIEADATRMRQVLHNLVKNALEATRNAAPARIRIVTRWIAETPGPAVELRVEDSGPGIPQELLANLFEPYVTTKPKGTGLGLAIVKKIVDEHGGVVWAANRNDGGAAIYIRLPAAHGHKMPDAGHVRQVASQ